MRKYIVIVILLAPFCKLLSSSIDSTAAKMVAVNFLRARCIGPNTIMDLVFEEQNGQTTFYVVNFVEGGWVMVSASDNTVPVLCYSLIGTYRIADEKPEAFSYLINSYKERIINSFNRLTKSFEVSQKWQDLLNKSSEESAKSYTPGNQLLNVPGRGHVRWNQSFNWSGTCTPCYNAFFPTGECICPNVPAGCGPVAMGQIMWYWRWPEASAFRTYDWENMPQFITKFTNQTKANNIALLLDDIGNRVNVWELCGGTMSTVNNIEESFNDDFGYEVARKYIKTDWQYGSAWKDLLRSEIDNGRPILYRGDKSDWSTSKHIFVLDGYDSSDPDYFWFNFGWAYWDNESYNVSRHYLNDIIPDDKDFTDNQMAVVGISPTFTEIAPDEVNITNVTYTYVIGTKSEDAQQNISLPGTGMSLTVASGGKYTLTAGNSITLLSGFKVQVGGEFLATINPDYQNEMDISVLSWPNYFVPGNNEQLCFTIENADSWEFEVFSIGGSCLFQSAGTIGTSTVCVWDGSGISSTGWYTCHIRFKNNFGRDLENTYNVYVSL